jgi:NAD-dependent deacetylase
LHHAAGSRRIHELHGNIRRVKCFDHGHPAIAWDESAETPPRCAACGSRLRPDVVWFGEMLPEAALEQALEASRRCDLFLSVGTSGLVEPAASLAFAAADAGAAVIEVNPRRTPLTARATIALAGSAATLLPLLAGPADYDAPRRL